MGWVKLDDGFAEHPKIDNLSDGAFRLYVAALGYVARNLTDGVIPEARLSRLVPRYKPAHLAELLDDPYGPVWHAPGHLCDRCPQPPARHYTVHDYLEKNPSAEKERERRRVRSEAGRLGGQKSGAARVAEAKAQALAEANASSNRSDADEPRPRPVPVPSPSGPPSTSGETTSRSSSSPLDDDDEHRETLDETWNLLAARHLEQRDAEVQAKGGAPIRGVERRRAWRAQDAERTAGNCESLARIYLGTDPDLKPKELADLLDEPIAADVAATWNRQEPNP